MDITKETILKFVELVLAIACLAMHFKDPYPSFETEQQVLICATFGGYTIILIGMLVGLLTKEPISKRIDIIFSLVGCALFIASGAVIIVYYDKDGIFGDRKTRDLGLTKGSLAIINGAVFLLDLFFSFQGKI